MITQSKLSKCLQLRGHSPILLLLLKKTPLLRPLLPLVLLIHEGLRIFTFSIHPFLRDVSL
ncbi:ORF318 [White spot syndrome virus]|uniref:ORF318 n=1 Tax=White spot syndrome virus TaxID=342409 RepID=A0A2D3I779_9VIRU|nr:ORF318 [White spot syndrome virus]